MPKLPQDIDYGQRPSLRTNRVDLPGNQDVIMGDAISRAANNLGNAILKYKEQADAKSYSTAKTQLLKDDIRIRRELEEEGDWENYMDDYRERMTAARDEAMTGIYDAGDREMFSADSELTVERGVSAMSEMHRRRRSEHETASAIDTLDDFRRDILDDTMDQATRVDIMISARDFVAARVKSGDIPAHVGENMIKGWVADVSKAQMMTLPLRTRIALLEASISGNVDPDAEDFMDQTTGSLADFMHQDERIAMLKDAEKLLESEETLGNAQAAFDTVVESNPYNGEAGTFDQRRAMLRGLPLSPEERQAAENLLNSQEMADRRSKVDTQDEIMSEWAVRFRQGKPGPKIQMGDEVIEDVRGRASYSVEDIPREQWNRLSAGQQATLKSLELQGKQGRVHAETTTTAKVDDIGGGIFVGNILFEERASLSLWNRLSPELQAQVDLDSIDWMTALNEADYRLLQGQQRLAREGKAPNVKDLATNYQLVRDALIADGWVPKTDQNVEEQERFARTILEFNRLVYQEQVSPGLDNAKGYPDYNTRLTILGDLMRYRPPGHPRRRS
jgi:hypothetical protein